MKTAVSLIGAVGIVTGIPRRIFLGKQRNSQIQS